VDVDGRGAIVTEVEGPPFAGNWIMPVGGAYAVDGSMLLAVEQSDRSTGAYSLLVTRWLPNATRAPTAP
jgi:hypothetical protein